jgi:DNA primase
MQENMFTNWFNNRKVSDSVLKEFSVHLGVSPIMGECIVIPVHDENGIFSFNKYRRDPRSDAKPKYIYDKGGKVTLYGWWHAKDYSNLLITEGELDCLTAWSHNIPAITSTGGSMSFQQEWSELLKDKDVTLLFDNDEPGAKGMVKALKYIPHAYVCFLPDRPGIKDVSDYMSAGGDIHELLRTRIHFNNLQDVKDHKAERMATFRSTFFHDAYIEEHTVPDFVKVERKPFSKNDSDKILNAKGFLIPNINGIKFDRAGKAKCIWHNEATPSLTYYPKTNSVYCFGCGKGGDAIDVYRQINNCTFKEAIEELNK